MTNEMFLYGGKSFPVVERDGQEFADFGEKGLKLLKRNESGELVKGFPGREPGSTNGTTSSAAASENATTGLWAKIRANVAKALQIEPENVGIIVTTKTVTVNADEVGMTKSGRRIVSNLCTWSNGLHNWLDGNPGIMALSTTVQDEHTKAAVTGLSETLNNWHK